MYSAEGECTLMYLGVYSIVLLEYIYSTRTSSVLQWYSDKSEGVLKYTLST